MFDVHITDDVLITHVAIPQRLPQYAADAAVAPMKIGLGMASHAPGIALAFLDREGGVCAVEMHASISDATKYAEETFGISRTDWTRNDG